MKFDFGLHLGKQLTINRNKLDWETLNTPKIKTVFQPDWQDNDYGYKLRFKCHQRIQRKEKSINGELCANWDMIDSFGVRLDFDDPVYHTEDYEKFYDGPWWSERDWLSKIVTVNHRSLYGEKGFILTNGTYERFEPIGIAWNDTYCRRITDAGSSGCFVERDLSASDDFDSQENNCTGTDSTILLGGLLQACFSANSD